MKSLLVSIAVLFTVGASAQEAVLNERVLIPVYSAQMQGAYGSVWTTELVIRNGGSEQVSYLPLHCVVPCFGPKALAPGRSVHEDAVFPSTVGHDLRLSGLDNVHFSLRVRDLSRRAESAGVEIPVVREHELRGDIVLPSVPIDDRFRHTLRVYDLSTVDASAVRLRVYEFNGSVPVLDDIIELRPRQDPTVPSQIALGSLDSTYPILRTLDEARFEIESVTPGMRIWAFVSSTNNETQEVTIITPQ